MVSRHTLVLLLAAALFSQAVFADTSSHQQSRQASNEVAAFKKDNLTETNIYGRVIWVFALGASIAFVAILVLRYKLVKFNGLARLGAGRIALVEAKRLAPRLTAVLAKVDGVDYLIVTGEDGVAIVRHEDLDERGGQNA